MASERDSYTFVESNEAAPDSKGDGIKRLARATKEGDVFTADWLIGQFMAGNLYTVNVGTVTTPIASAGALDVTKPDVHMQVPSGVLVYPIAIDVNIDLRIDDQDLEIVASTSNGVDSTPTGGTSQTVVNRNMAFSNQSGVTVQSDVTAITSPVTDRTYLEFWRVNGTYGATPVALQSEEGGPDHFHWDYRENGLVSLVNGGELSIIIGKATINYFATLTFVAQAG